MVQISLMMMMFTYIKNYNERLSQNLYSIRFHTDQPRMHKYKYPYLDMLSIHADVCTVTYTAGCDNEYSIKPLPWRLYRPFVVFSLSKIGIIS
jgi:hypothetical protein